MRRDIRNIFTDEICCKTPKENCDTNRTIYNHKNEIWIIDLADFSHCIFSNNKRFRYICLLFDNFSKDTWATPFKNRNAQTVTSEFSNILTASKRNKQESNRGADF